MRPVIVVGLVLFVLGCQEEPPTAAAFRAMAAKGLTSSVRRAAAHGIKIDAADENGFSALSVAAFNGHRDTVVELLKLGARPDAGTSGGRALVMACAQNRLDIAETLLAHGAKAQYDERDEQPLAATTDSRIMELLIRAGANINAPSGGSGNTALHQCASKGAVSAIRYLLKRGAKVNSLNSFATTPLHIACRTPSLLLQEGGIQRAKETIRLLVAAGASVNVADARGNTPLHFAARNPYLDAEDLRVLVEAGAKLDARDGLGRTPLVVAQVFGTDRLPGRLAVLRSVSSNQPK